MHDLCTGLEVVLNEVAGERVAFVLTVAPFHRLGGSTYATNADHTGAISLLRQTIAALEAPGADVPLHLRGKF